MKKLLFILFFGAGFCLLLSAFCLFYGCETCKIKYPKNLKPIDWENYNDVHTVVWNFLSECNGFDYGMQKKNIMIYGWMTGYSVHSGIIQIKNNSENTGETLIVRITNDVEKDIYEKLFAPNWPKKCFAKGELLLEAEYTTCCRIVPELKVNRGEDIYFE